MFPLPIPMTATIMSLMEKMTLEQYKQQVEQCLIGWYKDTAQVKELMKAYEKEFPEFLNWPLTPLQAAGVITSSLY